MSPSPTTANIARKIITMNPMQPEAMHVAVRDGRILAAFRAFHGAENGIWGTVLSSRVFQAG